MGSAPLGGFWGKVLVVDVGTGEQRGEPLDERAACDFLGGRGLAAYYLFNMLPAGADPLGPENPLIFASGPLSGTTAPGSARAAVATKSPQTGLYLFCITGGTLGPAIKRSGFDIIVLTGRSEEPVYVEVTGGKAKIHPAGHLWGLDTLSAQEYIRDELPRGELAITCIGPGGENLVPYACLLNERRALGRGGAGAVMGSKNVKAMVVRAGPKAAPVGDPGTFKEAVKKIVKEVRAHPFTSGPLKLHGSGSTVAVTLNSGLCRPTTGSAQQPLRTVAGCSATFCGTAIWSRTHRAVIRVPLVAARSLWCAMDPTQALLRRVPSTRPSTPWEAPAASTTWVR